MIARLSWVGVLGGLVPTVASAQCELWTLQPFDDPALPARFGHNVAIGEDRILVSAPHRELSRGAVYVHDARSGMRLHRLEAADRAKGDWFGGGLEVEGALAIIGAPSDADFGEESGSAYLFDVTTGAQLHKMNASDAAQWDSFGIEVDVTSDWAIVGCLSKDDLGELSGAAYLFSTATGAETHRLLASDGEAHDYFGSLVGIHGDLAVVCAKNTMYLFDAVSGTELARIPIPGEAGECEVTDRYIVVGNAWAGTHNSGAVYVFDTSGNKLHTLLAEDGKAYDYFGIDLDVHGDVAVIGALDYFEADADGSAYLFDLVTGQQLQKIEAPEPDGRFGLAVGIGESRLIFGDYEYELAFVYTRAVAFTDTYCGPANLNSTGASARIRGFGYDVASCEEPLTLTASNLPRHQVGLALASRDRHFVPFHGGSQGNLCLGGTIGVFRDHVQRSGKSGSLQVALDLQHVPPLGQAVQSGETWHFQVWFRDENPGPTSNFTDGLSITFD